jgi:polysaccharide biosynthesis/export protein
MKTSTRAIFTPLFMLLFSVTAAAQSAPDYLINAGDAVEVAVWKEPDLTKTVGVRPDGRITLPLVGEISAAGRTLAQVQIEIANRLKKYLPDPVVTASLVGMEGNRVYVIGQVTKPGSFIINPRLNILQALSLAGGMTPFAATNDIVVLRSVGGKKTVLPFKYGEISRGRNPEQNVPLEAGDVVLVP